MDEFSSRTRDIEQVKERLVADYVAKHGRQPSPKLLWQFRQQATLETRPPKQQHSLSDLTAQWRERATELLGEDAPTWATTLLAGSAGEALLRADDIPLADLDHVAEVVVARVGDRRTTWKRWNLHAEAVRQTRGFRIASATDRDHITRQIVDAAEGVSLRLTPPELASSPPTFRSPDGSSVFRPKTATVFSSEQVLAAEDRLLTASKNRSAPTVPLAWIEQAARTKNCDGRVLSPDQERAIAKIGVSGRTLDVLVGPAGTGNPACSASAVVIDAASVSCISSTIMIPATEWNRCPAETRGVFHRRKTTVISPRAMLSATALERIICQLYERLSPRGAPPCHWN